MLATPMDPSDCFLSLKEITLVLVLKLLALLATLRLALFRPAMSLKPFLELELVLEEDLEVEDLLTVFSRCGSETLLTFLFGTDWG